MGHFNFIDFELKHQFSIRFKIGDSTIPVKSVNSESFVCAENIRMTLQ